MLMILNVRYVWLATTLLTIQKLLPPMKNVENAPLGKLVNKKLMNVIASQMLTSMANALPSNASIPIRLPTGCSTFHKLFTPMWIYGNIVQGKCNRSPKDSRLHGWSRTKNLQLYPLETVFHSFACLE